MQHAPPPLLVLLALDGPEQADAEHELESPRYLPELAWHSPELVTTQKGRPLSTRQHAPFAGCGQGLGEQLVPTPLNSAFAAAHRAWAATTHSPRGEQHAPALGCGQVSGPQVELSPL